MDLQKKSGFGWYFCLFKFVAENRIKSKDLDLRDIHTHLVVMITTGVLMWGYATIAYLTINSPVPGIVGYICSMVHFLSPLLFRVTKSHYTATNVLIGSGLIHQATYSYFTGGFESHLLIWFGILPMLAGVMSGLRAVVTWLLVTTLVALAYLILLLNGFKFPNEISKTGSLVSHAMLVFGWIFLSSSIVTVYVELRKHSERLLETQNKKIEDVFRVLFHDLANPLGRVAIGISIAKKTLADGDKNRGLEIAQSASDSMLEITQNVRKMYAVSKGKANVDLVLSPFEKSLEYVEQVYAGELERKNLKIVVDKTSPHSLHLMVEPVSFNNQVFGNIISNAIKFSPVGSEIHVKTRPVSDGRVWIEVKDNGIGIPKSLLPLLFDVNQKTSRPGTTGETGTGFGMHIMKSFVEMYGGEIAIDSIEKNGDEPSGTTIRINLKGEWK